MIRKKSRLIAYFLLATLVSLLTLGPARAEVWAGAWDPQYGSPFTIADGFPYDLGWGGKLKVNDDACGAGPFFGDLLNSSCGGGAFVVGGTLFVTLYDVANPTLTLATLSLNAASLTIDKLRYDTTGKLTGISTTSESNYVLDTSAAFPTGAGTGAEFAVQFVLDGAPYINSSFFGPLPETYDGPVLFARYACGEGFTCLSRSDVATYPAVLNFTSETNFTPEPASLALVAGGLLAAGAAARRRRVERSEARSA